MDTNNDNKPNEDQQNQTPQLSEEPKVQQSVDGVIAPPQTESQPVSVNISSDGDINDTPEEQKPTVDKEAFANALAAEEASQAVKPQQSSQEVDKLKSRIKKLKIWLVVVVLLLVAVGSALAVYFYTQSKNNEELEAAKAENAQLEQQLAQTQNQTTEQAIAALNSELEAAEASNAELQSQVDELTALNKELVTVANDLKTQCGEACSTTEIPTETE